jgi:hypothetical protein
LAAREEQIGFPACCGAVAFSGSIIHPLAWAPAAWEVQEKGEAAGRALIGDFFGALEGFDVVLTTPARLGDPLDVDAAQVKLDEIMAALDR